MRRCASQALAYYSVLSEQNVPLEYVEGEGLHDIPYWDGQLEDCFAFLKKD